MPERSDPSSRMHEPCARRNPAAAVIGNNLFISGGHSDESGGTLGDTWSLNMVTGKWNLLAATGAPELEGHKAVVSGLDIFTFGGHLSVGAFPHPGISVNTLSLGQEPSTEPERVEELEGDVPDEHLRHIPDEEEDVPLTIPLQLLLRLLEIESLP